MPSKKANSRPAVSRPASQSRFILPGSEKPSLPEPSRQKPAPPSGRLTVSVVVRCKHPLKAANCLGKERLTRTRFRQLHGPDPNALKLLRAFAREYGLAVQPGTPRPGSCIVKLTGTVAAMQRAFGIALIHNTDEAATYRVRQGNITLPTELSGHVEAVLG